MTTDTARKIALGFGAFYLLIGVLGFIPGITQPAEDPGHGLLLGIFAVNPLHNIVHLVAGAVAAYAGMAAPNMTSTLMWALATIFALIVPASLVAPIVEAVPLNAPDTLLHLASALLTGFLAFSVSRHAATA